jgi:hypothetical protein
MTDDEIKQELDDAEFSIEIDCLRDPDFIKVTSGKVYRPERTADKNTVNDFLNDTVIFTCNSCGHEVFYTDAYCSHCGSRFI